MVLLTSSNAHACLKLPAFVVDLNKKAGQCQFLLIQRTIYTPSHPKSDILGREIFTITIIMAVTFYSGSSTSSFLKEVVAGFLNDQ
jgi:hypothetical protein